MKNYFFIIKINHIKNIKLVNFYIKKKIKINNIKKNNNYTNFIFNSKKYFLKKKFIQIFTPEIEFEKYNFKLLNILKKDFKGSFYLKKKILRTHTSCFQNRFLKNFFLNNKLFNFGKVYRNDNDSTHLPFFYQIDFLLNNFKINYILKIILFFFSFFYKKKFYFKIRKTKFPFTINSFEIDILNNLNWLEISGFGETNKNIIINNKNKNKFIAGGLGVDRIFYIIHKINKIKKIYD